MIREEKPATLKQLAYIQRLTGDDYRDANLSIAQASSLIEKLQKPGGVIRYEMERGDDFVIPEGTQPFTKADNTLIEGEQRTGKTITGVAKVVDPYNIDACKKYLEKEGMKDFKVLGFDKKSRIAKVRRPKGIEFIKIPDSYKMVSDVQIFTNIHLYGIRYARFNSYGAILDGLESGIIQNGYLLMDEYYVGAYNRESMTAVARNLGKNSNQYAKKMLRTIVTAPLSSQLTWEARLLPNTHINTVSYDERTHRVTIDIKKKGEKGYKRVSYDATEYMKNYWTNESIHR